MLCLVLQLGTTDTTDAAFLYIDITVDLSGRRLSSPPAKGVYIENGKKRVAR
ncbi:MAG: hypothetical protein J5486_09265 [Bacteroidaceae bacterium]|nr:hypothetical protein [Bacteroidaceae bacterium]